METQKLEIIHWLTELSDQRVLEAILQLKKQSENPNWWDELTVAQKEDIEAGLLDLEEGRKRPFSEILKSL
ncbi:hypothetical protein [Marinoscillum furvescens]|uniref:Addiction module component n=1 Tax=Marinoscillum furvescens DSM 4134 TaxID=1122208 RepID=A0A3D9KXH6_MARFU|nr:hypothetical protein [Marinoscillum furvescens]RED91637.1 hypothetical protein C7460_13812 [Marinoscillum furvescens DSM 4134]